MKILSKCMYVSIALILGAMIFPSCEEGPEFLDSHSAAESPDQAQGFFDLQGQLESRLDSADYQCFEINFPVDLNFPDGSTQSVNSEDQLDDAIDDWIDNNPNSFDWPELAFPIQVTLDDGTVQSVADDEELCKLYLECYGDEFEDEGYFELLEELAEELGDLECYDIIFPVDVVFPDSTVASYSSQADLEAAIEAWETNNPDTETYPDFVYPIQVSLTDGSIDTVANEEELCDLHIECLELAFDEFFDLEDELGEDFEEPHCFDINFPVDVVFPDGTTQTMASEEELDTAIADWEENNPFGEDWPTFSFPIDVTLDDGTTQSVANDEELCDLFFSCWDDEFDWLD